MTYFRAGGHYHRPRELNGRVRNGNACDLTRKVTGKQRQVAVRRPAVEEKRRQLQMSSRPLSKFGQGD